MMVLESPHLSETITKRRTVGGVNAYGEFVEGSSVDTRIRAAVEPIADRADTARGRAAAGDALAGLHS